MTALYSLPPMTLSLNLQPDNLALPLRGEPQLGYILLTINAQLTGSAYPVNWALIADASRSMRIPIVSEEQFRQLVRTGGAQEVLVDGVPVWQLANPVPSDVKVNAPSALDYIIRALHSIVERLDADDRFTLIAYAEQAAVLTPNTRGDQRAKLVEGIGGLKGLRLGEETDLAEGLQLGLAELARGRDRSAPQSERLILLTDGFTRNPDACRQLARRAADAGVTISTLGLGGEFQDDLLTALADVSGGRATFLRRAETIPHAVAAELDAARSVAERAVTFSLALFDGAVLRRVTRISPTLTPLEPGTNASGDIVLHLGDIERGAPTRLLLEILAPPAPSGNSVSRHLATCSIASEGAAVIRRDLRVMYTHTPSELAPPVLAAAARANAVRLQRRALAAAANGNREDAQALLQSVARRLNELGETALADVALHEAEALQQTGRLSDMGAKELTYATRRLGERDAR